MVSELLHDAYPIIALFALVEGPFIAMAVGAAAAFGYLDPFYAYAILVAGALIQDMAYYWLGRAAARLRLVRALLARTRLIAENILALEVSWRRGAALTLLLAKLAYGLYAPLVIVAGLSGLGFARFARAAAMLSPAVIGLWLGLGYGLGRLYGAGGRYGPVVVGVLAAGACVGLVLLTRHARRRIGP